jgi:hypothetical protein
MRKKDRTSGAMVGKDTGPCQESPTPAIAANIHADIFSRRKERFLLNKFALCLPVP